MHDSQVVGWLVRLMHQVKETDKHGWISANIITVAEDWGMGVRKDGARWWSIAQEIILSERDKIVVHNIVTLIVICNVIHNVVHNTKL